MTGEIYRYRCPICGGADFEKIADLYATPESPTAFKLIPNKVVGRCGDCATLLRLPLEILPADEASNYGAAYYGQMASSPDHREKIINHIKHAQIGNYDELRAALLARTTPEAHHKWLDVGSSGPPTAFDDFHFTTIEPDMMAVEAGRSLFRPERIHCNVIEHYRTTERYDGVCFMNSLYCTPTPEVAIARAAELTRPGGWLVIRIGNYFMGYNDTPDGENLRIEDVLRGTVMWVYHSKLTLEKLAGQNGYVLIDDFVGARPSRPDSKVRYLIFEKRAGETPALPSIAEIAAFNRERFDALTQGFAERTQGTLRLLDRADTMIVCEPNLAAEMNGLRPFERMRTWMTMDMNRDPAGFAYEGLDFYDLARVKTAVQSATIKTIAVLTFRDREMATVKCAAQLSPLPGNTRFLVPNRQSGYESLCGYLAGPDRLIKGLTLVDARIQPRPGGGADVTLGTEAVLD